MSTLTFQDWGTAAHSRHVRLLKAFNGRNDVGMISILADNLFYVQAYMGNGPTKTLGTRTHLEQAKNLLQDFYNDPWPLD